MPIGKDSVIRSIRQAMVLGGEHPFIIFNRKRLVQSDTIPGKLSCDCVSCIRFKLKIVSESILCGESAECAFNAGVPEPGIEFERISGFVQIKVDLSDRNAGEDDKKKGSYPECFHKGRR